MIEGVSYYDTIIENGNQLFHDLHTNTNWDESMLARKTASFGVAYNYSQISYPYLEMPKNIEEILVKIADKIGFEPNNCLINYYADGKSKMGYHSDQTDILMENTGVAILSLGETRILRFRNIENRDTEYDYALPEGSLIYMTQEVQQLWQHSIPTTNTENPRMSLTFRKIK